MNAIEKEIRVALVGCGGMAKRYRTIYARLPGVRWVAAVDAQPTVLEECRAEGAERCSTDFAEAIAGDVDAVVISTPNHLHASQAIAALEAGKHVLLQKPIANTVEAADSIVAAAEKAHKRFGAWAAMYMSNYEEPTAWAIKAMLDAGALGTIQSVRARDAHRGGLTLNGNAWRANRDLTGGGSFVQLSIHAINMMCWWLDTGVDRVVAMTDNRFCQAVGGDDCAAAVIRFHDGTIGTFDSGYASDGNSRELYGTRGWVRFWSDREDRRLEMRLDQPFSFNNWIDYTEAGKVATFTLSKIAYDDLNNPYNQHVMFIDRLRANRPPHRSVQQGRDDLAAVAAAYRSALRSQGTAAYNF